jgi:hypothetical protein
MMKTDITTNEVQAALDTMRDDPEICHTAEEVLAQIPQTLDESDTADVEQLLLDLGAGYLTRQSAVNDIVRFAAHDLYRGYHGIKIG